MRMSDCETVVDILSEFAKRDPAGYIVWGQKLLAAHNRECEQFNAEIGAMCKFNDALNAVVKRLTAEIENLKKENASLRVINCGQYYSECNLREEILSLRAIVEGTSQFR